jgi:hypothetical protein
LDHGLFAEGTSWRTHRHYLIQYLLEFTRKWWLESADSRTKMLADAWAFKSFAYSITMFAAQAQAAALLHLVFPEIFEDIISKDHKAAIAAAFAEIAPADTDDVDRKLLAIRKALTPTEGEAFSFYNTRLKPKWYDAGKVEDASDGSELEVVTAESNSDQRYWKIAPGEQARLWKECLEKGIICIGWNALGDLRSLDRAAFDAIRPKVMEITTSIRPRSTPIASRSIGSIRRRKP